VRKESLLILILTLALGFCLGVMYSPAPAGAASKEIIQLQQDVSRLIASENNLQTSIEQKHAVLKTLLEQSLDNVSRLSTSMGGLNQTVQQVQANTGSRLDSMGTQLQAMVDNLDELKSRLAKLNQQMADSQSTLQGIDARLGGGPAAGQPNDTSAAQPAGKPPAPADVLYPTAKRDLDTGKTDLARQEFQDYLKYYPDTELAGNAQFYLGEISRHDGDYAAAVEAYDRVLMNYPKSIKAAGARLGKGLSLLAMGQKPGAIRELREVVRRYPGTPEARSAAQTLRQLGVSVSGPA
jgi:tol-pal system protein YbgF